MEQEPERMIKSLLATVEDPDELLINFRKNVLYVILKDENSKDDNKIRAKILDVNGRQTYKPKNDTTAILLYLLSRDDNDPVILGDFLYFINKYFPEVNDARVRPFLIVLDHLKLLKVVRVEKGTQGARISDLDPVGLLPALGTWGSLELETCDPPICKSTTFFSTGYGAFNVKR
jgi:hypothetical protein